MRCKKVRIFGLTLIEIIFITCLTGSVSAMGVERLAQSHEQANKMALSQLQMAIHSMNSQVYSMALLESKQGLPSSEMQISEMSVPIQYGFIKDSQSIQLILEQTLLDLGTLARIKDFNEFSHEHSCVLYYQAPTEFGNTANITINDQGC